MMFNKRLSVLKNYMQNQQQIGSIVSLRKDCSRLISTELMTALRPFYFAVHPDRFGKHPVEREINENSLKQLSAHMEALKDRRYHVINETKTLQFYIRDANANERDTFKRIQFKLDRNTRDPRHIIESLLKLCGITAKYASKPGRKTTPNPSTDPASNIDFDFIKNRTTRDFTYNKEFMDFSQKVNEKTQDERKNLMDWIENNSSLAQTRAKELSGLVEEVDRLRVKLIARLKIKDLRYDCGWNYEHFRGCLKSLERLANMQEQHMHILKNRIVVFAPFTGVSLVGHIMLFTGYVLNSWIDFIQRVPTQDLFLQKIPKYENTLSKVLLNIRIGRRKFMPKQQAVEYAGHLTKVTTTLGDYLTTRKYPKSWPRTLSEFELVVESEAGPLMVSPTGQIIIPATCPGFMLIDFITQNIENARELRRKYNEEKHVEQELMERCKKRLQLKSLTKDDSVTPDKMIETLRKLLKCPAMPFYDLSLHIANYYSVLSDGIVCIPWDFPAENRYA